MVGLTGRRNSRISQSRTHSRTLIINILRFLSVVVLTWGEFGAYFWSLSACRWPELPNPYANSNPTRVLLISDAQVEHPSIFSHDPSWTGFFRHLMYDLYLKRSWRVTKRLGPGVVIFLGDMLTTGKYAKTEQEYQQYFEKFQRTFSLPPGTLVYYLPGNNDVGMGTTRPSSKHVRQSFHRMFGPFNQRVILHNHTLVLLDAPGLVDEDYTRSARGVDYENWKALQDGPVEFVKSVDSDERPLILLSHIPLWRVDTAPCGPFRERGNIHKGVGHGYQNMLGKETTMFLLDTLRPSLVFSGDNRDYCEYNHRVTLSTQKAEVLSVPEVTVKSFSTTRHIRRPGFQLLSLTSPNRNLSRQGSFADTLCLLPDRSTIYGKVYPLFTLFTLSIIVFFNVHRSRRLRRGSLIAPISLSSRTPSSPHLSSHYLDAEPWTPYSPTPTSPRSSLPPSLRTPNTFSEPTFRVASRPATPQDSPLLSPLIFPDDEEDSLYPTQYALRSPVNEGGSWSPDHALNQPIRSSLFSRHQDSAVAKQRHELWSWTWVFRGRRRRITIFVPSLSWTSLKDLVALLGDGVAGDANFRRRGFLKSSVMDLLSVAWLSALTWSIMAWWSF